jgi:hypothetical protein
LFDGIKDRQLARLKPTRNIFCKRDIVGAILLRRRLTDELNFEAVIAVKASQNQGAGRAF